MQKIKKNFLATILCSFPLFLFLIQAPSVSAGAGWDVGFNLAKDASNLPENKVDSVIFTFLQWLLLIFTFISVIAFIIAGVMFLTTGGDAQQATTAKNYVKYAIIGIAVGISGYIVLEFIDTLLSGEVQSP